MRKIKIISGVVLLGMFVWACSDSATSDDDDTVNGADAGKDSTATGDDTTGDDSTSDDDATVATDSSTGSDGAVDTDSGPGYSVGGTLSGLFIPPVVDGGVADSGIADSGVADSGIADSGPKTDGGTDAGPDAGTPPPPAGSVVLQNNAGDDLTLGANGAFTFAKKVAAGGAYAVTVKTQPGTPAQTCVVTTGTGTANANVSNVAVNCTRNTYNVGGSVSGLVGTLVLQNNAGDDKTLSADGMYTFPTKVASGNAYNVTVKTQPAGLTCTVVNSPGTVGATDVTNVNVSCAAPKNCQAIKTANAAATSGMYNIDPDGFGGSAAIKAYCDMTNNGGGWTEVYDQDSNYGGAGLGYLPVGSWASTNITNPDSGQYSILNLLSSGLKTGTDFEFLMTWSGGTVPASSYIQWKQTQDPTTVTDANTVTFSSVVSSPTNQGGCAPFAGLARKTVNAYLSGERSACYWFPVGSSAQYSSVTKALPAYNTSTAGGTDVAGTRSKLFVR